MNKTIRILRVTTRQAFGLATKNGRRQISLEALLNRAYAQGYVPISVFSPIQGHVVAVVMAPPEEGAIEEKETKKEELPDPEIVKG